jgi:hypothetical protein
MEVHPPHRPLESWWDFFVHLFTITVGLLIALGLEAAVEAMHNRHLLHKAEANLHSEMLDNREVLTKDEAQLQAATFQFSANLRMLTALRAHTGSAGEVASHWYWSNVQQSAWETARDTGALALMPYEDAQGFAIVYGQQDVVNRQAAVYITDIYRGSAPLQGDRKLADLQPAEIDMLISNTQQTLADISHLTDLCHSLDVIYDSAARRP